MKYIKGLKQSMNELDQEGEILSEVEMKNGSIAQFKVAEPQRRNNLDFEFVATMSLL